ncbi:MAG TPA: XdhC/CoxI family protein [Solirubrobacterales bacterium]|nr:XdhC/CoxI family protein [Solirubrobacterales bacterium]
MRDVIDAVEGWVAGGNRVALATVVDTKKSAPQPSGTKMAVNDQAKMVGAVSGGCVEGQVVQVAEGILAGDDPQLLHYGIADEDAWDVGLPCGGEISIWVETYEGTGLQGRFAELARRGGRGALVTVLEGPKGVGAKLLVTEGDAPVGSLGGPELDAAAIALANEAMWSERSELREHDGRTLFVDAVAPPPRLIIFGAVDFAAQLAAAARMAGWRAFVVDPRKRFATAERFPDAERVIAEWPDKALDQLGGIDRATSIAVLTHDPKLDDAVLRIALRSEAQYIGAMGSRRAQEKRRERLLAQGLTDEELGRLAAPIGLDIGALTAAETAISIMGEITAVRRGREGGRLIAVKGRIHDAAADEAREAAPAR